MPVLLHKHFGLPILEHPVQELRSLYFLTGASPAPEVPHAHRTHQVHEPGGNCKIENSGVGEQPSSKGESSFGEIERAAEYGLEIAADRGVNGLI